MIQGPGTVPFLSGANVVDLWNLHRTGTKMAHTDPYPNTHTYTHTFWKVSECAPGHNMHSVAAFWKSNLRHFRIWTVVSSGKSHYRHLHGRRWFVVVRRM